jgi:NAD-dependent deacetylase sirtuin 2
LENASSSSDSSFDISNHQSIPGCGKKYSTQFVKEQITLGQTPRCTNCNGLVKPDIVFFGEQLPERFHDLHAKDLAACDALIVMGTSLQVAPFSNLINMVRKKTPRLLINMEKVAEYNHPHYGFDFDGFTI